MSAVSIKLLGDFRTNIVAFLDELIEQFPQKSDLIILRIFLKDQVPIADIMNRFITDVLPIKEKIKSRDENFFLENNVLFDSINSDKVSSFKTLWGTLDHENQQIVWKWFDLFVSLSEKYLKSIA